MGFIDVIKEKAKADKKQLYFRRQKTRELTKQQRQCSKKVQLILFSWEAKKRLRKTERDLISAEQRLLIRQHMKKQKHILQNW